MLSLILPVMITNLILYLVEMTMSTILYIQDAERDGRSYLVELWNEMKKDKQKHLSMLRQALEKEAKEEKISQ